MHLIVAIYASPRKVQEIVHFINREAKYPFEGPDLKGYTRPFMSQLPGGLWDIRCKKEIAPLILRDLNAAFTASSKKRDLFRRWTQGQDQSLISLDNTRYMSRKLYFAIRVVRFVLRLQDCPMASGEPSVQMIGWSYVWFIGAWPDAIGKDGQEVL